MLGDLLQEALRLTGFDWVRACWRGIFWAPGCLPFLPALPSLDRNGYAVLCCLRFWMGMDALADGGMRDLRGGEWSESVLAILCVRFLSTSRAVRLILRGALAWMDYVYSMPGAWCEGQVETRTMVEVGVFWLWVIDRLGMDVQAKQAEDDLHEDSHAQGQGRGKAASWTVWAAKVLLSTTVPTIT